MLLYSLPVGDFKTPDNSKECQVVPALGTPETHVVLVLTRELSAYKH